MPKSNSLGATLLRHPVIWGGLGSVAFYAVITQGWISHPLVTRYCASHPIEYIAVTLFFAGIAALLFKSFDVAVQLGSLGSVTLGEPPVGSQAIDEIPRLQASLAKAAAGPDDGYLVRRLHEALQYIQRKGSADSLDEHLRFAADVDLGRMHSSYALIRIIIWAIPILGFLGTVIGITLALAKLGVEEDVANSLPLMISGLYVAFDTTALALALSMVLMFGQFFVDRFETRLLAAVDDRTSAELVGRFEEYGAASDPQLASIRRMSESVVESTRSLVRQQAEIWKSSINETHLNWSRATQSTGKQLEETLSRSLSASLDRHAAQIAESQRQFALRQEQSLAAHATKLDEARKKAEAAEQKRWSEIASTLEASVQALHAQQSALGRQGDMLMKVVDATGNVRQLESALNDNLAALAGSRNFEETVMSLAAAIQLLTTRLNGVGSPNARVELNPPAARNNAA
ncbi:MAG: MotA/TolQ/ExbB proton channel family protein [Planctomycetales bacterium]|nr:MotA/TolQ/ExbB proton channel family protein [Planctomycetales bacterium]